MAHYSQWHAKEKAWVSSLHDVEDPAWFGLIDFKVLLLEKRKEPESTGKAWKGIVQSKDEMYDYKT